MNEDKTAIAPRRLLLTLAWLTLLGTVAYLWELGSTGLVDETEPLFAVAARQMVETGDWLTPYFNEVTRFDKPPLIYWLMAAGYKLFGFNTWAVRLPSALCAIALICFSCYVLQRFVSWQAGILGAGMLALNLQNIVWGRQGVSDMLLSACMGGTLLCFFCGYATDTGPRRWRWWPRGWYWGAYLCCALAILAKGPVGLVLPGLIVLVFIFYAGQGRAVLCELGLPGGFLTLGAIAMPWFVAIAREHGSAYIDTFFGFHNIERFTSVVNRHAAPWYFYFLVVLLGFFPWSVYLPWAAVRLQFWRQRWWARQPRSAQLGLFAFCWFAVIFGFFSVSVTKLPSYTLPLLPAAALLVAWALEHPADAVTQRDRGLLISAWGNAVLALALTLVFSLYNASWIGRNPAAPDFGLYLDQSSLPERGGIIWAAIVVGVAIAALQPNRRRWLMLPNLVGFLAFVGVFLVPGYAFLDAQRQRPLRQLAEIAGERLGPNERLVMVGLEKPTLVFYSQYPAVFLRYGSQGVDFQQMDPSARPSALFVGDVDKLRDLRQQASRSEVVARRGAYFLVRVWY